MKTTLLIILLSVSGLQIVSTGKEPKCVDFNTYNKEHGSRSLNIVKEEDGYFYYLYDRSCWDLNTINVLSPDERFFLKVFMGNTYDDVLASIDQIENWYKNVEEKEYIIVKNPDGQQVMLYKIYSGGLTFTYGNIDDIKIRGMESTYTGSTTVSYYRILSQLANGTFHPTKTITKKEWHDSVREFKKRYNNDK